MNGRNWILIWFLSSVYNIYKVACTLTFILACLNNYFHVIEPVLMDFSKHVFFRSVYNVFETMLCDWQHFFWMTHTFLRLEFFVNLNYFFTFSYFFKLFNFFTHVISLFLTICSSEIFKYFPNFNFRQNTTKCLKKKFTLTKSINVNISMPLFILVIPKTKTFYFAFRRYTHKHTSTFNCL